MSRQTRSDHCQSPRLASYRPHSVKRMTAVGHLCSAIAARKVPSIDAGPSRGLRRAAVSVAARSSRRSHSRLTWCPCPCGSHRGSARGSRRGSRRASHCWRLRLSFIWRWSSSRRHRSDSSLSSRSLVRPGCESERCRLSRCCTLTEALNLASQRGNFGCGPAHRRPRKGHPAIELTDRDGLSSKRVDLALESWDLAAVTLSSEVSTAM